MILKTKMLVSCAAMTLAGCSSGKHGAEEAVRQSLKDPDSAKFGDFYYNSKTKKACLTVNAKNEMGGYTGNKQVSLKRHDNGWEYVDDNEITSEDCRAIYADKAD